MEAARLSGLMKDPVSRVLGSRLMPRELRRWCAGSLGISALEKCWLKNYLYQRLTRVARLRKTAEELGFPISEDRYRRTQQEYETQ